MWPQLVVDEASAWSFSRGRAAAVATAAILGLGLALWPAPARAQIEGKTTSHAGSVVMNNDTERQLFSSLRCMCGTCARDLLSTCACNAPNGAEDARAEIRAKLARGETAEQIVSEYVAVWGPGSLAVPPNVGAMRAIYAVPIVAIFSGAVALGFTIKKWRGRSEPLGKPSGVPTARDAYDDQLDEELKDLDG
jgi:cytochrome c-type biogenesis protein CcmH/NrfF